MNDTPVPRLGEVRIPGSARPRIEAADAQDEVPVDTARWATLAAEVLVAEGVPVDAECGLHFVDEATIAALNQEHLGGEGPTDVLAFPLDGPGVPTGSGSADLVQGGAPMLVGDVVVCPAVAARHAPTHAGSLDDELALLVVHGLLHLLGHDHAAPDDRAAMEARERALLARFHGTLVADPWAADPRAAVPRHSEPGHSEPGHSEPGHSEPGHSEPGDAGVGR